MNKIWQWVVLIVVLVLMGLFIKNNKTEDAVPVNEPASLNEENISAESSADSVMSSIYADAEVDASSANTETEEDVYVDSQVDGFINIKDSQYE